MSFNDDSNGNSSTYPMSAEHISDTVLNTSFTLMFGFGFRRTLPDGIYYSYFKKEKSNAQKVQNKLLIVTKGVSGRVKIQIQFCKPQTLSSPTVETLILHTISQ